MHFQSKTLGLLALAIMGIGSRAAAATIVYQNTTTTVGAFEFNGAATVGTDLAANIDINLLTLAAGSAGESITSLNFIADNFNAGAIEARPTIYVWAPNGAGGNPGTLLGDFVLPNQTLAAGTDTITYVVTGLLAVPSDMEIWAGIGFDNDSGASPSSAAQLDALGGPTYHPATVGTDGPNAFFIGPGSGLTDPAVIASELRSAPITAGRSRPPPRPSPGRSR
jgi:hypothetical protein